MHAGFEIVDPLFAQYILFNAKLETLASGFRWTEGPVWFGDANALLFSDIPNNRMLRWIEDVGLSVYRAPSQFANGHTRDRQGRLISCSHGLRAVTRTEYDGTITILADRYGDARLNSPNDVIVKSDGSIWFTDPLYGIASDYEGLRSTPELKCNVYRLDPQTRELTVVADDFAGPNGLAFSPDESRLYIAETGLPHDSSPEQHVRVFTVEDGNRLRGGNIFYKAESGPVDGMRCDEDGNIWTSAGDGVHCVNPAGALLGKIYVPEQVANLTFGGRMHSRLFICATTSVYAIYLNRRGIVHR
jgi:gluconolactonase